MNNMNNKDKVRYQFGIIIALQSVFLLITIVWGCPKYGVILISGCTIADAIAGISALRKG